jgi:NAD(P)-dependent dehydrogenase (short-subunit alcohol dehydrogenase family)
VTRVALVTGGGSGIGRAAALALAADGWSVVICGRRRDALEATAAAGAAAGAELQPIVADVCDRTSVADLFAAIASASGRLDLLFNNAGVGGTPAPIEAIELEDWERVLATNVTGVFLCTQQAIRLMKRQSPAGGRIVNNGSLSAHVPRPLLAAYTAAKHAVTGLTRQTALEGRPFGIACGQIDIGNAASDLAVLQPQGMLQADGTTQAEPVIDTGLVARGVVYMASLPLDANVLSLTVMATAMPYVGRG